MIPATRNNCKSTETGQNEPKKLLDPAENLRKVLKYRSSIPIGKFSDFSDALRALSGRTEN